MSIVQSSTETIAALATPIGIGGIAVIRISGDAAFSVVESLFSGKHKISESDSHTIRFGTINDPSTKEIIDTVLASIFHSPHSFTGEDIVEISSHGGYFTAQKILSLLYSAGARPAYPGEFTLRAFLNGKLDLAQAEAVADIIYAKTEKAHRVSVEQLSGRLSTYIQNLRSELLNLCSLLELELDFSQEGIELAKHDEVIHKLDKLIIAIQHLVETYSEGKMVREGVRVALIGKPNAGKSSLLNVLLEEDRAIVSDIPGTTRDAIEESIVIEGIEFAFTDTAGLREAFDIIEKEGIRRTTMILERSDIVLLLLDSSFPIPNMDAQLYTEIINSQRGKKPVLISANKSDIKAQEFIHSLDLLPKEIQVIETSCLNHSGISYLKKALFDLAIPKHDSSESSITITNIRHKDALDKAVMAIESAKKSVQDGLSGDFTTVDLRVALDYLGEIIGLTTPDDILNNIFSNFCIGK